MTTVEQIRTEIEQFKATVVSGVDSLASQGHISQPEADAFLSTVGIERPESAEVRAARAELTALKDQVREAVRIQTAGDSYRQSEALRRLGL